MLMMLYPATTPRSQMRGARARGRMNSQMQLMSRTIRTPPVENRIQNRLANLTGSKAGCSVLGAQCLVLVPSARCRVLGAKGRVRCGLLRGRCRTSHSRTALRLVAVFDDVLQRGVRFEQGHHFVVRPTDGV